MNRAEFLKKLKDALKGSLDEYEINKQVAFYINYINEEIAMGKDETDVVKDLGDPRLIAKTIKTVQQVKKANGDVEKAGKEDFGNSANFENESESQETVYEQDGSSAKESYSQSNDYSYNNRYNDAYNRDGYEANSRKQQSTKIPFAPNSTSVLGCIIGVIVIFLILCMVLRFFGLLINTSIGLLVAAGPVGIILILLVIWLVTRKDK